MVCGSCVSPKIGSFCRMVPKMPCFLRLRSLKRDRDAAGAEIEVMFGTAELRVIAVEPAAVPRVG